MEDQNQIDKDKNLTVYFLELMKREQLESKLSPFLFKIKVHFQISDLRESLNVVNSVCEEIKNSSKLKDFCIKVLYMGNGLGSPSCRELKLKNSSCDSKSYLGFKLDMLSRLIDSNTDTRRRDMRYLCMSLAIKDPKILEFPKDLANLEAASKIQLKSLAEEIEAIANGLEKAKQELAAADNNDPLFKNYQKTLKEFVAAEAELSSVKDLFNVVVNNADKVMLYFGEDPAKCSLEKVVATLIEAVEALKKTCEDNITLAEQQRQRAGDEAASLQWRLLKE